MLNKLSQLIVPQVNKVTDFGSRIAPEVMLAGGITAGVLSVIMIAKAHRETDGWKENLEERLAAYREIIQEDIDEGIEVDEREIRKGEARIYASAGGYLLKAYGRGVLVGVGAIALVMASHGLMKNRLSAVLSLATLLESSFEEYRNKVKDEYGEEADQRLYYGAEARDVVTLETNEDGKKKKRKSKKNHLPEEYDSRMYSRVFEETNINWFNDPSKNEYFLRALEQWANDRLYLRGALVLNDVYTQLGFEPTPFGAVVGWTKDGGDGYVSFGLDSDLNAREGDDRWLLDFNVEGVMYNKIGVR